MKHLYFVRHGQSYLNVKGHFAGTTETPLTDIGKQQAKLAGQAAQKLGIDLIVSSPLSRAHDTARIIAEQISYDPKKIITSDLLLERHYGTAEDTPYSLQPNHLDNFEDFETDEEINARADKILAWLKAFEADNILVVSHGGIGRRLRALLKPDHDFTERIPNAEIVQWL